VIFCGGAAFSGGDFWQAGSNAIRINAMAVFNMKYSFDLECADMSRIVIWNHRKNSNSPVSAPVGQFCIAPQGWCCMRLLSSIARACRAGASFFYMGRYAHKPDLFVSCKAGVSCYHYPLRRGMPNTHKDEHDCASMRIADYSVMCNKCNALHWMFGCSHTAQCPLVIALTRAPPDRSYFVGAALAAMDVLHILGPSRLKSLPRKPPHCIWQLNARQLYRCMYA
jgi:hypothetical protein